MKVRTLAVSAMFAVVVGLTTAGTAGAAEPVTSSPPTIQGTPVVGKMLTAGNGLWRNSPTGYSYQWLRCDAKGNNCSKQKGETDKTYTVRDSDVDHTIVVLVTASNGDGKATANSKPTDLVTPAEAPGHTTAPSISGRPIVGQQLVADPGKYLAGGAPDKYGFQWQRCDRAGANCVTVAGATGQTYGVRSADVGHTIRVQVHVTNEFGSTDAISKQTAAVTAASATVVRVTTTLSASRSETICCQSVKLSGTISSAKAGEVVSVLAVERDDLVAHRVAIVTTGAGGAWTATVTPAVQTTYTAQTSTTKSVGVTVQVHPRVGFGVAGNNFSAKITGRDSFGGRVALFQVMSSSGNWQTKSLVVINVQSVARFRVPLKHGHTYLVRIYLPDAQAGLGYLDGVSHMRRVGGTA